MYLSLAYFPLGVLGLLILHFGFIGSIRFVRKRKKSSLHRHGRASMGHLSIGFGGEVEGRVGGGNRRRTFRHSRHLAESAKDAAVLDLQ